MPLTEERGQGDSMAVLERRVQQRKSEIVREVKKVDRSTLRLGIQ